MRTLLPALCLAIGCAASEGAPDLGPIPPAQPAATAPPADEQVNPRLLRRFRPLRASAIGDETTTARVELGKLLFFDPRISRNRKVSCNTCHELDRRGVDGHPTSRGVSGKPGRRNAPTVYNAAGHIAQFWDGRAADLAEQAAGPFLNPDEMGMSAETVASALGTIPGYAELFRRAFPREAPAVTFQHARLALAEFERTLTTPSRWDRYLRGDKSALTHAEVEGLKVFADVGCVQCHTGELVGGSMFQRVGVAEPWPNQLDQGRYEVTKLPADRMVFKVPSLRNVTRTAPFFHDGSVTNLPDAVGVMARHQLGIELTPEENDAIVAWLGSLDGAPAPIDPPELPADGARTPR